MQIKATVSGKDYKFSTEYNSFKAEKMYSIFESVNTDESVSSGHFNSYIKILKKKQHNDYKYLAVDMGFYLEGDCQVEFAQEGSLRNKEIGLLAVNICHNCLIEMEPQEHYKFKCLECNKIQG